MGQAKKKLAARAQIKALQEQVAKLPVVKRKWFTLKDWFVVKRSEVIEELSEGKHGAPIALAEISRERSQEGVVRIASREEGELKVGDQVIFTRYGGTKFKLYGEELMIVHRTQIYLHSNELEPAA